MNSFSNIPSLDSHRKHGSPSQFVLVAMIISFSCLVAVPESAAQEPPAPPSSNPEPAGSAPEPGPAPAAAPGETRDGIDRPPRPGGPPRDRAGRPERRGDEAEEDREPSERDRRRGRGRALEGLTGEQQQKLRQAMAEAWRDEDVVAARKQIEDGMEAYRNALRDAIIKSAPELEDLLPENFDGRGWLGDQRSAAMSALRSIMAGLPPELQQEARRRHADLMRDPEVAAAARALEESFRKDGPTPTGSRLGMTQQEREFRSAYVAALARQVPEAAEFFKALREGGGRERPRQGEEAAPTSEP